MVVAAFTMAERVVPDLVAAAGPVAALAVADVLVAVVAVDDTGTHATVIHYAPTIIRSFT